MNRQRSVDQKTEPDVVTNGVIEVRPLFEGGLPVAVVLTEKGERMANGRSCQ